MTKPKRPNPDQPLRGEAAFNEVKRLVAERNDAAHARWRAARAAQSAAAMDRRRAAERRAAAEMPSPPTPD